MKILNAEPEDYSEKAKELLGSIGKLVEEKCDRGRLLELIPDIDVLIVRLRNRIDREVLGRARNLKVIVSATTGLNHIDLDVAEEMNIRVLSLKGERKFLEGLTATAELTWGLLLSLIRDIPNASRSVVGGFWDRNLFRGHQLKNKTLGVVGFGRLGSRVAEYGKTFQMNVISYDPYVETMPKWVEKVDFEGVLRRSDILTLHVNLNDETTGLLDREAFSKIKKGAVLINTSRGELIDENELVRSLVSGNLAGAALDVLCNETSSIEGWLHSNAVWRYAIDHDNVIIVPHIGGATVESMADAELFMAEKLAAYLKG